MSVLVCRYCGDVMRRKRSCSHNDVCVKCHRYLYCEGKPPRVKRSSPLALLALGVLVLVGWNAAEARDTAPPAIARAIQLAAVTYKIPAWQMLKVAGCESSWKPAAKNPRSSARGLFQFLTTGGRTGHGTWGDTPYRRFDVNDPVANALAAAYLVRLDHGWSEWRASYDCHHLR